MKKFLFFLVLASPVYLASAQDNKTPYLTRSLASDNVKTVFVNTSGGSISVKGGEEPRIEVYIVGNNRQNLSKDEIKKRLDEDYTLDIAVHDGELHATAKQKHNINNWRRSLSIGFRVYVNKATATNLNTSGGSISIANLTGNQNFETSGGSLSINTVVGIIKGETSGGSISVANSSKEIELTTSGGSINASNCQGHIKLETSGGSVRLDNLKGYIKAETSGGSVNGSHVDGELIAGTSGGSVSLMDVAGSVDASTSAGSIHVQMTRVDKYVKIDGNSGHVDLQLPAKQGFNLDVRGDRVNMAMSGTFEGQKEKEKVVGKLNGGGSLVEVRGDGSVNVSY
ncbi:DUF4097 family beta strand repeat protein [Mucilaginibacter sp. ZT4R22]|uniref:DUF4097 family beta strand repeat protein n=1 Tax=Mucilaginibacter pankratovii TaxID=2772110 RepID=A0ABR7WUW0_9SPHI|nr:DUF4097 family beta strand repeat-containing protein [Mucilaginibacter pankratovii]MBD1365988.1 DUF4097 family beta strand repeat protein [Mucilaginibacter pankratovii]